MIGVALRCVRSPTPALSLCALVLVAAAGCSSSPSRLPADASAREAVISPERGRRGNPPVYEVLGQRYYVLETSAGYRERGTASWYGRDFHGKPTSGGEPYDMYEFTAAHRTLPIPTWVEVTHLGSGRRVIVKVNDRGPFVDNRVIDLSYAAAQQLGMVRSGTARVEVRALGEPVGQTVASVSEPEPIPSSSRGFSIISDAAAATPDETDRPMQQIFAQVGAFSQAENARRLVGRLRAGGINSVFILTEDGASGDLHRVRVGPLANIAAYDQLVEGLASLGLHDSRLIFDP